MMPLGLWQKELRQLLPWALALFSVDVAMAIATVVSSAPDFQVWAENTSIFGNGEVRAVWLAIWALILAFAGFPREHDDGTLIYLFSLPVSRSGLFLAKASAAALVLLASVVFSEFFGWIVQLANPASMSGRTFRLGWAWLSLWSSGVFALIALGYALFLSVLRRFGLLVVFLVATVLAAVQERWPAFRRANAMLLLDFDFQGTEALVPWTAFAAHGGVSLALGALAGYFWVGRTERLADVIARWVTRTSARVVLALGIIGGLVALVFIYGDAAEKTDPAFGATAELESPEAVFSSARYRFRYPGVLRERVEKLGPAADALHDQVASALAAETGTSIEVDLTKSSPSHAGSATWSTIRLDLSHAYDDRELLRTLAHETAHVLALRVSDRRTQDAPETTRFFDEGLAEHLAWRLVPHPAGSEARWLEAVLAHRRLRVEAADLFDFAAFSRTFGEPAIYPVAMSWIAALCATCGDDAPARALRALSKPGATEDASGRALWQRTLQTIDCDLSRVELAWADSIRKKTTAFQSELDRVPDLVGGIGNVDDDLIVFRAEPIGKPLEGSSYRLHTRVSADDLHARTAGLSGEQQDDGSIRFLVAAESVDAMTLHFQLVQSWFRSGAIVTYAQKWQQTRISPGR